MLGRLILLLCMLQTAAGAGCARRAAMGAGDSPKAGIVQIAVQRRSFANAPPFDVPPAWFERRLRAFSGNPALGVDLGAGPWRFSLPYALEITWSLRPADRIRPLEGPQEVQDRAVEVTVSARLVPLYPHSATDVQNATAGKRMN